MQDKNVAAPHLAPDEVSVKLWILKLGELRRYLISNWKIIIACTIIGAVIGIAYAMYRKPLYKAVCTFVLEDSDKGGGAGLGQYSALASIVGIDVGTSSGLFQGDNIIQLYKSRKMMERTLLSPVRLNNVNGLLIDRYLKMKKLDVAWKDNEKFKGLRFDIPRQSFTVVHDSIVSVIVDDLNNNYVTVSKPDKKLSIINVEVKAPDPVFAKAFTEKIVTNVNAFYIQTKTLGMATNLKLLQRQADSVRRVLNLSISGAAAAADSYPNANPLIQQSLRAPSQRKQVDVQASGAIYAEVVKNLEIAKSSLQRETPLIQIIDEPILPLPNDRLGKSKAALTGMVIAFMIAVFGLIIMRGYRSIMA